MCTLSDLFTTVGRDNAYRDAMSVRLKATVVEIVSNDINKSLAFYRLLGLGIPDDPDGPHVEVQLPGGNRLAFDTEETIAGMHPGWTPPQSEGRVALAFETGSPREVDELFEKLTTAGHPSRLSPFDAPWGQRYATVADPDGTNVDLFAPLAN